MGPTWMRLLTMCTGFWSVIVLAEPVHLRFNIPSGATSEASRMYFELITKFKEVEKDIEVEFKPADNYEATLANALESAKKNEKSGVIVAEISELLTLKYGNAIIPLGKFIDKEPGGKEAFLGQFIRGFLGNSIGDDDQLYGLPVFRSTPLLYVNLDLLKQAGINPDVLPRTWDEFTAALQKITAVTKRPSFYLAPTWYDWVFECFVVQNGGSLANKANTQVQFNSPETIEALAYWKDLQGKGLLARVEGEWKAAINRFAGQGEYPYLIYSSGGLSTVEKTAKFNWNIQLLPQKKRFGTPVGAGNIFISTNLTPVEEEAAWKLIKFFLRPQIQAVISANTGFFPVVTSAFEEAALKEKYGKTQYSNARKQLEYADAKIMTKNYAEIRKILKKAIDDVLDKDVAPKDALKVAQEAAQPLLR